MKKMSTFSIPMGSCSRDDSSYYCFFYEKDNYSVKNGYKPAPDIDRNSDPNPSSSMVCCKLIWSLKLPLKKKMDNVDLIVIDQTIPPK